MLIMLLSLIGCIHNQEIESPVVFGKDLSGSPCIDGVYLNVQKRCNDLQVFPGILQDSLVFVCLEPKPKKVGDELYDSYTSISFIAFPLESNENIPEDLNFLCQDLVIGVGY